MTAPVQAEEKCISGLVVVTFEAFDTVVIERHVDGLSGSDAIAFLEHEHPKEIFHVDRAYWDYNEHHDGAVAGLARSSLEHITAGKNFTVIFLGEQQSKTSLLFGDREDVTNSSFDQNRHEGLVLQVLRQVVDLACSSPATMETSVKLTAVEISPNDKIRDCLASGGSGGVEYRVRNHPEQGYFVENATSVNIASCNDLPTIVHSLRHNENGSAIAASQTFSSSSASRREFTSGGLGGAGRANHLLIQLCVKRRDGEKGVMRSSTVSIVEVGGTIGSRGESKSLGALRRVVDVLSKNRKAVAPTRDAVLTTLLTESFGGNCETVIVGSIVSSQTHQQDSLNVLRMIQKARGVVCTPRVNEEKCTVVVKAIEQQMEQLRRQLTEDSASPSNFKSLQEQLMARTQEVLNQREEKERLKTTLEAQVQETNSELSRLSSLLESRQLVREEALRMEREVARLQAMRDLAAQKLLAENEISHRVEEELEKAKVLEQEVFAAQQRARAQEDIARIENEKQQQRMMAAIFRASKMIGQDRQATSATNADMARLRELQAELEQTIRRVDERITAGTTTITLIEKRCAFLQEAEAAAHTKIKENEDLSHIQVLQKLVLKKQEELRQWTVLLDAEEKKITDLQLHQSGVRQELGNTLRQVDQVAARLAQDQEKCTSLQLQITRGHELLQELSAKEVERRREIVAMERDIDAERVLSAALVSKWQRELTLSRDAESDFNSLQAAIDSFGEEKQRLNRLLEAQSNLATSVAASDHAQRRAVECDADTLLAAGDGRGTCTPLKKPFAECRARFDASPVTKRFIQRST